MHDGDGDGGGTKLLTFTSYIFGLFSYGENNLQL